MKMGATSLMIVAIIAMGAVVANVPNDLRCRRGPGSMGGACALASDKCCESYAGQECRRELNQYESYAAPLLQFFNESLVFDPLMKWLCVKGLKVPEGNALRGSEIEGVYLEIEILKDTSLRPVYFSTNTIIFPGLVFSEAMRNGLFCAEVAIEENEWLKDGMHFVVKMVPLPPGRNRHGVTYLHKNKKVFVPTQEVPRRSIRIKNCQNWTEEMIVAHEEKESKICSNSTEPKLAAKTASYSSLKKSIAAGFVMFIIGCVVGHIGSKINQSRNQRKSIRTGDMNMENPAVAENLENNVPEIPKDLGNETPVEFDDTLPPEVQVVSEIRQQPRSVEMPNETNASSI